MQVVGEYEDGTTALAGLRARPPDLVFLDVQMPGMSGLDVLAALSAHQRPLTILLTAHEGFAVAADDPIQGELTLHQWAAGMRRQKLAPDMRKLMGTEGFYQSAPSRAYTVAGSFLRFLADTYGAEKVRVLYAHADFQQAYGRPLNDLVTEWERYVDALPLD